MGTICVQNATAVQPSQISDKHKEAYVVQPTEQNPVQRRANRMVSRNVDNFTGGSFSKYPSLADTLKSPYHCKFFERFVLKEIEIHKKDHGLCRLHRAGLDYLRFWLEAEDYACFPASEFRTARAHKVHERYVMHGAEHQITIGSLLAEEISAKLEDPDGPPDDMFKDAQFEAFEFLNLEIFPRYMRCFDAHGFAGQSQKGDRPLHGSGGAPLLSVAATSGGGSGSGDGDGGGKHGGDDGGGGGGGGGALDAVAEGGGVLGDSGSGEEDPSALFRRLLKDGRLCAFLRSFMEAVHAEESVLFFLDVLDFQTMVLTITAAAANAAPSLGAPLLAGGDATTPTLGGGDAEASSLGLAGGAGSGSGSGSALGDAVVPFRAHALRMDMGVNTTIAEEDGRFSSSKLGFKPMSPLHSVPNSLDTNTAGGFFSAPPSRPSPLPPIASPMAGGVPTHYRDFPSDHSDESPKTTAKGDSSASASSASVASRVGGMARRVGAAFTPALPVATNAGATGPAVTGAPGSRMFPSSSYATAAAAPSSGAASPNSPSPGGEWAAAAAESSSAVPRPSTSGRRNAVEVSENALLSSHHSYVLMRIHKIYDKYIRPGAPHQVNVSLPTRKQLQTDLAALQSGGGSGGGGGGSGGAGTPKLTSSPVHLFDAAAQDVFTLMVENFYHPFVNSAQYQQYKQAEAETQSRFANLGGGTRSPLHRSRCNSGSAPSSPMLSSPTVKKKKTPVGGGGGGGSRGGRGARRLSRAPSITLADGEVLPAISLTDILSKPRLSHAFSDYAAQLAFPRGGQSQCEVHFLLEVREFASIPFMQTVFINSRAQKIYDKFVRRGAHEEVDLPEPIRHGIIAEMPSPHLLMFARAQDVVHKLLESECWAGFLSHPLCAAALADIEATEGRQAVRTLSRNSASMALFDPGRLDREFREILTNPHSCKFFRTFTEQEFCLPLLLFWIDAEEFKRTPRSRLLVRRAATMYRKYLSPSARLRMPVNAAIIAAVREAVEAESAGPLTFHPAQASVYAFLRDSLYKRFLESEQKEEMDTTMRRSRFAFMRANSMISPSRTAPAVAPTFGMTPMQELLADSMALLHFKHFCVQQMCAESLYFWMDAEDFRGIPGQDFLRLRARKIVSKYIADGARLQVNLPSDCRARLLHAVNNPSASMFQEAQHELVLVMEMDSLPRFLQSSHYSDFLNAGGAPIGTQRS